MPQNTHSGVEMNVRVQVGSYNSGSFCQRYEKVFSNTGTRFLTDSIARFIAGDENTYHEGSGRPNYLGFGTRGIVRQGNLDPLGSTNPRPQVLENQYDDPNPPEEVRTRPWFNSDSLGGTIFNQEGEGSFWNPDWGWGTESNPNTPGFQGELCTRYALNSDTVIARSPILNTVVNSDCPNDEDYGQEGYKSTVIFRGASTPDWLDKLLNPENGPVLTQIAVSELGLYEKSNLDPHGLRTMLAGFRVPSGDIIYLQKDEVILVEWTITIQSIMPYEQVQITTPSKALGIQVGALAETFNEIQFSATVLGEGNPRQTVRWEIEHQQSPTTSISSTGMLSIGLDETSDYIQVIATSEENPEATAKAVVFLLIKTNYPFGAATYGVVQDYLDISYISTLIGRGTFSEDVTWRVEGQDSQNTDINAEGLLTIDLADTSTELAVKATSDVDPTVSSTSIVTLLATQLLFTPKPSTTPSRSGKVVGRLALHSLRSQSNCTIRMCLTVSPTATGTVTISLRDFRTVVASYVREVTDAQTQTIIIDTPSIITSEKHQLSILIQGDATVPACNSFAYGAFIEELEWFEPTDDSSYIYEHIPAGTTNPIYYIDTKLNPIVPEIIDNGNTRILRATSFNLSEVEMVELSDGLTTIE